MRSHTLGAGASPRRQAAWNYLQAISTIHNENDVSRMICRPYRLTFGASSDGATLAEASHMHTTRIVKLADGEEMISFEVADRMSLVDDDPRRELLEYRRTVTSADRSARSPLN